MADLTARLLDPETFEEALKGYGAEWEYKTVVRELHARLRTAKAEGAAAREDVARMRKQITDYEEAEATVCPEDVGFVEFIGVLQKRIEALRSALVGVTPSYRVKGKCWCPHWLDLRSGHSDECKAARAAIDSARAGGGQ